MKREFYLYISAFLVCAGLAWWASLPESSKDPARKAIVSLNSSQVSELNYSSPELKVAARKNEAGKWWINIEKAAGKDDKVATKDRFLASAKMQDLMALLNPLEAVRVIGSVKDENLAEYGLKDASKSLSILDASGKELLKLTIGKLVYGSRNVFARESRDNQVIILSGDFIGDIERPELKLYERSLTNVVFEEVQRAEVTRGAKTVKMLHSKRDDKGSLIWTADSAEGSAIAPAKSWFERLDRVRIVSFAAEDEIAGLDKEKVLFAVSIEAAAGVQDTLVFVKRLGVPSPQGPVSDYYVKSKFLGTWAKVGSARLEPVEKDLPTIVAD